MLKQGSALANLRRTLRQRRNFMKNLKNKNYKPIAVFILITLLLFVFRIIAQAEEASSVKTILEVGVIGFLMLNIATRILTFTAGLVDFAVRLGNDVLNLPAVQSGWGIVLNITNLGFVLAIIIIAFATILRFESYAMKKTLWKLIVAALLVNFSLVIAGSIMSISNIASNVFYDAALGNGGKNLSNALANAMNPQRYGEIKSTASLALKYVANLFSLEGNINYIINLIFIIIFTFLTILAFVSLFVMLFMRAIILAFLLIVSPIIWLLWIFPSTQEHWKKWWSEFIRWNFFAPAVYFFIYLAVLTAAEIQDKTKTLKSITDAAQSGSAAAVFNTGGFMSNIFTHAANLFVVLGLLYGGIYVANKFGIAGGGIGVKWAGGVGAWAKGKTKEKTWGGIKGGYSRLAGKAGWNDKSIEASKKASDSTSMAGRFWHGLKARTYANLAAPAERESEAYKAEVSKLTMAQAMAQLSSKSMTMPGGRKAALAEYIKDNAGKISMPEREIKVGKKVKDKEGNERTVRMGYELQKGEKETGEYAYKKVGGDEMKQDWLEKNLATDSMKHFYDRAKMDFSSLEKKALGVSKEMVDARNNKGLDSKEFAAAAAKFYGGLKKSDAADIGKSLKRLYSPAALSDKDGKKLAEHIARAFSNNIPVISSMLPHLGGYKIVSNFQNKFKEVNQGLEEETMANIFKNFKLFEGGASPAASASKP